MSITPLSIVQFFIPFTCIADACRNTHINISSEYTNNPNNIIEPDLQSFLQKVSIRKDLIFMKGFDPKLCMSMGTNFFTKGRAVIFVNPKFHNADKEACYWLIKHEISHIKNNDYFTMPLVTALCSLAATIFSAFLMPVIPVLLVTISVGYIAKTIFSQYRERKADDFAIDNSSNEELKGGRRILKAMIETNLKARNTLWRKIAFSSTGECRLDFAHPSLKSRVKKIENRLQQQNIEIDTLEQSAKIGNLSKWIENDSHPD